MARKTGSSSSIAIPLSTLITKLPAGQIVKVSKGWLDAVQEANDIDFGVSEGEDTPATPAPADSATPASGEARPAVKIE